MWNYGAFNEQPSDEKDQHEQEDASKEQAAAFERELEALFTRLLPNAHTAWRLPRQTSRSSQRYLFVRCPVEHCSCNCLVDMDKGVRALGQTLTAAGWAAADLPAGPVRDVLTRPCPGTSGDAAVEAGGKEPGENANGPQSGGVEDGAAPGTATGARGNGGDAVDGGAGGAVDGREYVDWTDLPRYAQKAIHNKGRWCWFAGGEGDGAFASLRAHLVHEHREEGGLDLARRLLVPGGEEQAPYDGSRYQPNFYVSSYDTEPLPAPDDPRVVELAQELGRLVARHRPEWMQARKWVDDGAVVFGGSNSVELPCPCPGCNAKHVLCMEEAYNSFKVGLRSFISADAVPPGPLQGMVARRPRTCFHGWRNLPSYAQLGFIRAVRWPWFEEEWHTRDPYHGLRAHIRFAHRGDPEAQRIKRELIGDEDAGCMGTMERGVLDALEIVFQVEGRSGTRGAAKTRRAQERREQRRRGSSGSRARQPPGPGGANKST
ncbi:hypothetical protein HYH02_009478 [Chlamydomonas schloesseri]|uniref:Uncharacterized protein n=1 Tax=Chlamydomonas schloesseri TaxID=2026947 RepID=A0A835TDD9_9CHLO|nr:hypothetical protein HYH02_009478 [Chlamydomonas schloesseri]|eukprot:KAG2443063.1 hypothetical protein HYH02_009478 [Chlamydomonas schloesseri]